MTNTSDDDINKIEPTNRTILEKVKDIASCCSNDIVTAFEDNQDSLVEFIKLINTNAELRSFQEYNLKVLSEQRLIDSNVESAREIMKSLAYFGSIREAHSALLLSLSLNQVKETGKREDDLLVLDHPQHSP